MKMNEMCELEVLDRTESDLQWFIKNQKALTEEYDQRFIAIHDKKVVASDENMDGLVKKIKDKRIDPAFTVVQFVSKERIIF